MDLSAIAAKLLRTKILSAAERNKFPNLLKWDWLRQSQVKVVPIDTNFLQFTLLTLLTPREVVASGTISLKGR
jgi:hypothetical protein